MQQEDALLSVKGTCRKNTRMLRSATGVQARRVPGAHVLPHGRERRLVLLLQPLGDLALRCGQHLLVRVPRGDRISAQRQQCLFWQQLFPHKPCLAMACSHLDGMHGAFGTAQRCTASEASAASNPSQW